MPNDVRVPFDLKAQLRDLYSRETKPAAAPPAPAPQWFIDAMIIVCYRGN
jgi:hypothetical protein